MHTAVPERVVQTLVVVPELPLFALQVHGEMYCAAAVHKWRRVHGEGEALSPLAPDIICGHAQGLRVHMGQPFVEGVPDPDLPDCAPVTQHADLSAHVEGCDGDLLQTDAQLLDSELRVPRLREASYQAVGVQIDSGPEVLTQQRLLMLGRQRETPVSGQNFGGNLRLLQSAKVFDAGQVQTHGVRELYSFPFATGAGTAAEQCRQRLRSPSVSHELL